jgi:hypothetical protein
MTEDDVLRQVQALVAAGEYLDQLLGIPGARLSGGGAFMGNRRMYRRGTAEHLEARAAGLVEKLPPLEPPASKEAVDAAERQLGRPFPALLRRLYLEIGNGGFGPGYGIIGLHEKNCGDDPRRDLRWAAWDAFVPAGRGLFLLCTWGCAINSFVDCADAEARMWGWDPNPAPHDDIGKALFKEELSFGDWFDRWVNGRLVQPVLVQEPDSGRWRGATEEEKATWMAEFND